MAPTPDQPPNATQIKIYRNMRILPLPLRPHYWGRRGEGPKVFISGFVEVSVSNNREREAEGDVGEGKEDVKGGWRVREG